MDVRITDLEPEDHFEFCRCLESWSSEMEESGDHRQRWLESMMDKGLGVKLARGGDGSYLGMIQYFPALYAPVSVDRDSAWFIQCIWVHGHKEGQGNWQGQGIGRQLLTAAEEDIRKRGGTALLAWGLAIPVWMKAKWFKKHGFKAVDRDGIRELLAKNWSDENLEARWLAPGSPPSAVTEDGKPRMIGVLSGACSVSAIAYERLKAVSEDLGYTAERIDSSDPEVLRTWGNSDLLFIGGKAVSTGPPPSRKKLERLVRKAASKAARTAV